MPQPPYGAQEESFAIERTKIRGKQQALLVRCPQPTCGEWFIVPLKWANIKTAPQLRRRPCPHCFRAAKVPKLPKLILR